MEDDRLREIVGDELQTVLRGLGLEVVSASRINPLGSATWPREAFRLDLADGRSVKGLRLESAAAAERAVLLNTYLPAGPFPRIVAHHGGALVSEWIDGVVLSSRPVTPEDCGRMGAMLRSIHTTAVPDSIPEASDVYPAEGWRPDLAARVDWLCRAGQLEPSEVAQAMALADAHLPAAGRLGLVHGDLCPENIVVDALGHLHVIDNDGIDLHVPEFDLARTWYRWPMTDTERHAFEEGYAARGVLASYHQHFVHWAIVVLVGTSEFRLRWQLPGASQPLGRLREVLGRPEIRR